MSAPSQKKEKQQQANNAGKKQQQQQPGNKQQQKPKQSKANNEDVKREQKLQAVILADSFSKTFRPVSLERPKVMLPLVNVPMLDYTIEFLSQNGVEEIFVFCVWHAEQVEEHIRKSRWNDIVSITCISSSSCTSAGDALREIDVMNVIHSDPFILISGDVVANINLQRVIAYHKQKRAEDPMNVMTLTLKKVQKVAGTKPLTDDLVIAMNKKTSQLVLFDNDINSSKVSLPLELVKNSELSLSSEYMDCHVDICSPEFILQFSDNFDYRDIRKDFIHNEASNYALGKHLYGYCLSNKEYAARVQDFRSYHAISRDIVTRWVFPFVPDIPLFPSNHSYILTKRCVYKENNVKIARSAQIVEEVVLGEGCVVGEHSIVSRCVLGRTVRIGANVSLTSSHLWENVLVEDNVRISHAVISENVVIRSGCVIPRGCVIGRNVIVDQSLMPLKEYTRLVVDANGSATVWEADKSIFNTNDLDTGDSDSDFDSDEDDDKNQNELDEVARAVRMTSIGCVEEEDWKKSLWQKMPLPEDDHENLSVDEDEENDDDDENDDGDIGLANSESDDEESDEERNTEGSAGRKNINTTFSESDSDDGAVDRKQVISKSPRSPMPRIKTPNVNDSHGNGLVSPNDRFTTNVMDLIATGITKPQQYPPSAILMEIKSLKFSHNKSFGDCLRACILGLFSVPAVNSISSVKEMVLKVKSLLDDEEGLIPTVLGDLTKTVTDELEIILAIEDFVLQPSKYQLFGSSFSFFLHAFFDEDLLSLDALLLFATNMEKLKQAVENKSIEGSELDEKRLTMFTHPLMTQFLASVQEDEGDDDEEDEEEDD